MKRRLGSTTRFGAVSQRLGLGRGTGEQDSARLRVRLLRISLVPSPLGISLQESEFHPVSTQTLLGELTLIC